MDPVAALREIAYFKDRAREESRRVMAYRKAADVVEALTDEQRDKLGRTNGWQALPGVGPKTAKVIAQAWAGHEPDTLAELRKNATDLGGGDIRAALKGDLHLHSNWSDGSAPPMTSAAPSSAFRASSRRPLRSSRSPRCPRTDARIDSAPVDPASASASSRRVIAASRRPVSSYSAAARPSTTRTCWKPISTRGSPERSMRARRER